MKHDSMHDQLPSTRLYGATQTTMWGQVASSDVEDLKNPFAITQEEEERRGTIARHRAWMESLPHEYPNPDIPFRIGVYIRFFNQTSHIDYLEYHKKDFEATINLCPNWTLVDFYIPMAEYLSSAVVSMSIDMKKCRIRIHKPTLHLMGNPKLLQLLYDTTENIIALRVVDHEVPGGQELRVRPYQLREENCCDFYSSMLTNRLRKQFGSLLGNHTYRLIGSYLPTERLAIFPMRSIKQYDPNEDWHHVNEITPHTAD